MNINKYLLDFEHLNDRIIQFDLKLPDIICLKLLKSVSLSLNEKQIA